MIRSGKIPLVIIVLVSLVFASYWQFFAVQKAKASPTPPTPTSDYLLELNSDASAISVRVNINNTPQNFNFSSFTQLQKTNINGYLENKYNYFYAYNMTSPAISCTSEDGARTNGFAMIVAKENSMSQYIQKGIAYYDERNQKYTLVSDPYSPTETGFTDVCANFRNPTNIGQTAQFFMQFMRLAGSLLMDKVITWNSGATFDLTTTCSALNKDWEDIKVDVRNLIIPSPGSSDQSFWQKNGGVGWNSNTATAVVFTVLAGGIIKALDIASKDTTPYKGTDLAATYLFDTSVDYDLTPAGQSAYDTIHEIALRIQQNTNLLAQKYGSSTWPDGCPKLTKFKWNKNLENSSNTYNTLGEFSSKFDELLKTFEKFKTTLDTPTGTADSCGGLGATNNLVDILLRMFCGMAMIIHDAAAWGMDKAQTMLMSFVGIDISSHLATATIDTAPISQSSDSSTPAAATGATGASGNTGAGPTTPTATPTTTPTAGSIPAAGTSYTATATSCTPEPCFDRNWNYHGPSTATPETKAKTLCKQQRDNKDISWDSWNAGMCLAGSGFRIGDFTVNVMSKSDFAATPKKNTDYCALGGNWISMYPDCSGNLIQGWEAR
ncbi:MAG: hypothetical protein NTY30_00715 [Candidatus Berkelbacteria bacterium]|nr:hypothetical protein [Candidatus Berkelbacteria bacterium]